MYFLLYTYIYIYTYKNMSEEDETADCLHMIFGVCWPPEFSVLAPPIAGPRAGATPASDTLKCGQRRHSPTHPHLATPRQPFSTLRWSYSCLGHIKMWPEAALSNAPTPGNASAAILNAALELPLPRTHQNVARGGTLQRTNTWQCLGSHSQRCAGATPATDTFRGQRRHSPTHPHLDPEMAHFCLIDPSYCLGAAAVPVRMCLLAVNLRWVLTETLPGLPLSVLPSRLRNCFA